jgi:hypothetical protein
MPVAKPVFDPHALDQMASRGISEADVAAVLDNPIYRRPSYNQREEVFGTAPGPRTLKVVVIADSEPPYVITAMRIDPRRIRRS